ncbi:DUF4238 domain-containing protein [uncultured Microbulbifer sp.]|uniref:DUF4238 domain-containing protein n=1 Tax=uncultured Microbulbifer sp. TaxID=348147 RepID=UPI002628FBBF|nr:DUF4238 domain-containing protein [uncultured Microbulbifer sp.]
MNNPKKHHYIPKSYQLLFSLDDKNLFYFDKENPKSRPIGPAGPKSFCVEGYLYSLTGEAAKTADSTTTIENPILSTIDGRFSDEVKKLISSNTDKSDVCLYALASFLGFLSARHPVTIKNYQSDFDEAIIRHALERVRQDERSWVMAEEMGLDLSDDSQFVDLSFSESRNISLLKMVENAKNNAEYIHDSMRWLFMYSLEEDLLLCDNPFIMKNEPIEIGGLFNKNDGFLALVPLSRQLCLALSPKKRDIDYLYMKKKHVEEVNSLLMGNAKRWVISSSREGLENKF